MNWYRNFLSKISQYRRGEDYGGWIAPDGEIHQVEYEQHSNFITNNGWYEFDISDRYKGSGYGQAFDRGYVRYVDPVYTKWNKMYTMALQTPDFITTKQLAVLQRMLVAMRQKQREHPEAAGEPMVYISREGSGVESHNKLNADKGMQFLQSMTDDQKAVPTPPKQIPYPIDEPDLAEMPSVSQPQKPSSFSSPKSLDLEPPVKPSTRRVPFRSLEVSQ